MIAFTCNVHGTEYTVEGAWNPDDGAEITLCDPIPRTDADTYALLERVEEIGLAIHFDPTWERE